MLGVHRVRWCVRFMLFVRSAWRGPGVFSCASAAEVLCPQRGGLVPPPRRSCASTAEVLCLHCRGAPPPRRALSPWSDAALAPQPIGNIFSRCSHCVAVALPIKGLLRPGVHVPLVYHSPLAASLHDAVTAVMPQSRHQSRDYWSLQSLCRSLCAAAHLLHAAVTVL